MENDPSAADDGQEPVVEGEIVDGLPVLAEVRVIDRVTRGPAAHVAAAAATGFLAGAATLALARLGSRARSRALEQQLSQALRPASLPGVGPTRTYIVSVRLLERHGD